MHNAFDKNSHRILILLALKTTFKPSDERYFREYGKIQANTTREKELQMRTSSETREGLTATFRSRWLAPAVLLAASLVLSGPGRISAGTIHTYADAVIEDPNGNGNFTQFNSATNGLDIRDFATDPLKPFETRSVILFSLAGLTPSSSLSTLTFNFDEVGLANNVGTVAINAFSSTSSTITTSDATVSTTNLGSYDAIALGLGSHTVSLSTSYVQSLISSGATYLGIRLQGTQENINTQLGSLETNSFFAAPTLTYSLQSVPEPSSLVLSATAATMGGIVVLRRRRSAA